MAWANVRTYGLMERWRNRLIQQPYEFQQVFSGYADYSPDVWIQQERDELALVLMNEVNQFNYWVGYSPFPQYFEEIIYLEDNRVWFDQPLRTALSSRLIEFGQEATELLGTANVVYSGDVATITFTSTEVTEGRVAVIFNSTDSGQDSGDLRYEIFDLKRSYAGGDYTFVGHKSLFVLPTKQSEFDSFINGDPENRNKLDKSDANNFATSVDIYRVYTDTTVQAKLQQLDYTSNAIEETDITPIVTNPLFGEFYLSSGVSTELSGTPYAVKVYYKAGHPLLPNGNIFEPFESIIIRRAKVNLPISVDEVSYRVSANWRRDAEPISTVEAPAIYVNPIGDKLVDYYTWQTYTVYHDKFNGAARGNIRYGRY